MSYTNREPDLCELFQRTSREVFERQNLREELKVMTTGQDVDPLPSAFQHM